MIIAEKYRVVRQVGEGGMGSVYLVKHVKTDERFALKILHRDHAATVNVEDQAVQYGELFADLSPDQLTPMLQSIEPIYRRLVGDPDS